MYKDYSLFVNVIHIVLMSLFFGLVTYVSVTW